MPHRARLEDHRRRYAADITRQAWVTDPRIERAFAAIPREAFLPPPPWTIFGPGRFLETASEDARDLYHDVLVVLDAAKGINNGQPSLHAAWLAAVDPRPGDAAVHIGIGMGYYTAILAFLVSPGGRVDAYEIDERLAEAARRNLSVFDNVAVHAETGVGAPLPAADVVYVNAGAVAPDPAWLRALKPGGRLIFPWQPESGGVTLRVTRLPGGFEASPTMPVGFIPCEGIEARTPAGAPSAEAVLRTRSIWLTETRSPDHTATAVYGEVWFSSEAVKSAERPAR